MRRDAGAARRDGGHHARGGRCTCRIGAEGRHGWHRTRWACRGARAQRCDGRNRRARSRSRNGCRSTCRVGRARDWRGAASRRPGGGRGRPRCAGSRTRCGSGAGGWRRRGGWLVHGAGRPSRCARGRRSRVSTHPRRGAGCHRGNPGERGARRGARAHRRDVRDGGGGPWLWRTRTNGRNVGKGRGRATRRGARRHGGDVGQRGRGVLPRRASADSGNVGQRRWRVVCRCSGAKGRRPLCRPYGGNARH